MSKPWRHINTCPDSNDLMWFCRGDTYDGPREPVVCSDADYWDWWCYAVPPPLPKVRKRRANTSSENAL